MFLSCSTASVAAQHISLIAMRRPLAPFLADQVMSIVSVRNAPSRLDSTERIFSISALVRIG